MKTNFKIEDNIAFISNGYYDLHNDYDYVGLEINREQDLIILNYNSSNSSSV